MTKDRFSDYDSTATNNTDVGGVAIASNSNIGLGDDALREMMSHIADNYAQDTIASATTTDLGSKSAQYLQITGTTTITGLGTVKAGTMKFIEFAGVLTFTHNGTSLILPGGANITTAAGDTAIMVSEGSGNWRCLHYQTAASFPATQAYVTGRFVQGTPATTTSGTSHDFTGIPSWVKRVTVLLSGVSTGGTSEYIIQLGDSGGIEDNGYAGTTSLSSGSVITSWSSGILLNVSVTATNVLASRIVIENLTGNTWVASFITGRSDSNQAYFGAGTKTLSSTLTQIRLTTAGGANSFDAGTANILYE